MQHPTVDVKLLPEEPQSKQLMTSDQDAKVVAEPQGQRVQEGKDGAHLVSVRVCVCAAGSARRLRVGLTRASLVPHSEQVHRVASV